MGKDHSTDASIDPQGHGTGAEGDGVNRRGFLRCMQWAGTGLLWTMAGGVPQSRLLGQSGKRAAAPAGEFSFVQISDSHIGFARDANPDVKGTLQAAIDKINGEGSPEFLLHTGDITQNSKPDEFDNAAEILKSTKTKEAFYVPGEHDVMGGGKQYMDRYGKNTKGRGWYSFDHKGVHFIGLVNVVDFKEGFGTLGDDQLEWLEDDVKAKTPSTPIVVFAHIPLWTVYPQWGWGTADSEKALGYLKKFGSLTILNGHIHQTMQKVEGNVTFHTACSTAFPQPKPGAAAGPGPMKVPADQLRSALGITDVKFVRGQKSLAIVDQSLAS